MNDTQSGSSSILEQVQQALVRALASPASGDTKLLAPQLTKCEQQLSHFQVVSHFMRFFLGELEKVGDNETLLQRLEEYRRYWNNAKSRLFLHTASCFGWRGKTVVLHSQSGTIVNFLKSLGKQSRPQKVIQAEARPMLEGRLQAAELYLSGFDVLLATDMETVRLLEKADVLLLGADKIFRNAFINKTGSLALVLAASYFNKPVIVLADSRKEVSGEYNGKELVNSHPAGEVWNGANDGIVVRNNYLEAVPFSLVTWLVTEKGAASLGFNHQ